MVTQLPHETAGIIHPEPEYKRTSPRLFPRMHSSEVPPLPDNPGSPQQKQPGPTPDMPRRRPSGRDLGPPSQAEESSADERTAIAASGRTRSYDATTGITRRAPAREPPTQEVSTDKTPWMGFGAIELENKGSVARDHLALERTFLAWLRTSLGFASIGMRNDEELMFRAVANVVRSQPGIAITQLFRLNAGVQPGSPSKFAKTAPILHLRFQLMASKTRISEGYQTMRHMGKPLGATFIGIAIMVLLIGVNRYYESQGWLLKGKFPASRGSIFLLTLVACLLMIATLVIVVIVQPSNFEK
ncbi:unnamed protein product [Tuber aestivum]|uniref:DUF202 domain-containing protein n=1 Tax=Tuber aestivum TaxID=59557 RepID=A0A292Q5V6_9PEZI|nr:unnamed protein product [Tuber aestivum]